MSSAGSSQARDLPDFVKYAQEQLGVKLSSANPAVVNGIRGVAATGAIRAKEEFITVPAKSCLITTTDQICPFPKWLDRQQWRISPWYVRLGLLLLHERSKGGESPLAPWIAQLPKDTPTPLSWSAEDLDELRYPPLMKAVERQREEWSGIFQRLKASDSPGMNGITQDDLNWAMGIAYSRAFSGPYEGRGPNGRAAEVAFVSLLAAGYLAAGLGNVDQVANGWLAVLVSIPVRDFFMSKMAGLKRYALTPVIDFANHGGSESGEMAGLRRYALTPVVDLANHGGNESGEVAYNYFYDAFGAMAGRDFSPGSEVLISYGQRSNDHLLQYYGFVEKDNPHDVYELEDVVPKAIAHLTEAGSFDSSQATILEKSGLAKGGETLTYCKKGLQFPQSEAAMPALRLLALNESELGADKAAKIGIEDFKSQVSESNERAAWALAAAIAEQELAQAPSTPSQDAAILSGNVGKSLDAEKQLAIAFRIEKHKTLSAGVRALRAAAPGTGAGAAATAAPVSS